MEHSGFVFEREPTIAAQLLKHHSGGHISEALLMAMKNKGIPMGGTSGTMTTTTTTTTVSEAAATALNAVDSLEENPLKASAETEESNPSQQVAHQPDVDKDPSSQGQSTYEHTIDDESPRMIRDDSRKEDTPVDHTKVTEGPIVSTTTATGGGEGEWFAVPPSGRFCR